MNLANKKIIVDLDTVNWFDNNYLESKDEIIEMLLNYERNSVNTIKQMFLGCCEIKKIDNEKGYLKTHLKLIYDLSDIGINGCEAGKKLKNIILTLRQ